jgi:NAD-dependent dihydropyrimidine dehydrogenase PreA subunit
MNDRIPVILAKARDGRSDRERLQKQLIEGLSGRPGLALHVAGHLYDLKADGPGMRLLKSIAGEMIVLCWLYPRSTFWVLDANGVRGRLGRTTSLPEEEPDQAATRANEPDVPERTIWCFDLRTHDRAEPYLEEIAQIAEGVLGAVGEKAASAGAAAAEIEEAPRSRWYPVIDYGRCTNCLECLNFCIFGVYGLDEREVIVAEEPDACRPGCPACARICPAGAIMFPEHNDPAIAGDPKASAEGLKLDLSQLFGGADPAQLAAAERNRALDERQRKEAGSAQADHEKPPANDDLDRLVDELDELDL